MTWRIIELAVALLAVLAAAATIYLLLVILSLGLGWSIPMVMAGIGAVILLWLGVAIVSFEYREARKK